MKTNLQKLTELLCTVPEIEKDIKELRFGCEFLDAYGGKKKIQEDIFWINGDKKSDIFSRDDEGEIHIIWNSQIEIIGNPIQERHLRMYLQKYNELYMTGYGISPHGYLTDLYNIPLGTPICRLDNTKDLQDQTEETLGKILDFLTK